MPRRAARITADKILSTQVFADSVSSTAPSTRVATNVTPAPTDFVDTAPTITAAEMLTGLLLWTPTAGRAATTPTAALMVAGIANAQIGDTFDIYVINQAASDLLITFNAGAPAGVTEVGSMIVEAAAVGGEENSGSAQFRVRLTGVASGSEAYSFYRIA